MTPMTSDSFMIKRSSPSILTSGPLAEQDPVTRLDVGRNELAALVARAWTDGDHLAFLRFLLSCVGNDDAAFRLFLAFDAADDDAVVQWTEFHGFRPG